MAIFDTNKMTWLDEELAELEKSNKEFLELRGYILERTVEIEYKLVLLLTAYFCMDKFEKFRELIMDKEFFTFFQKIKIFNELQLHKDSTFGKKFDKFSEKLYQINDIRNTFAHGARGASGVIYVNKKKKVIDYSELNDLKKKFTEEVEQVEKMLNDLLNIHYKF